MYQLYCKTFTKEAPTSIEPQSAIVQTDGMAPPGNKRLFPQIFKLVGCTSIFSWVIEPVCVRNHTHSLADSPNDTKALAIGICQTLNCLSSYSTYMHILQRYETNICRVSVNFYVNAGLRLLALLA